MPGFVHQIPQPDWLTHVKFGRRGLVFVPWTDTGTGKIVYGVLKNVNGEVNLSIVVRDLNAGNTPLYVDRNFWIGENSKVLTLIGGDLNPTLPTDETYICENGNIVAKFSGVPVGRRRSLLQAALFKGTESEGSAQHYVAIVYDPEVDIQQTGVLYGVAKAQAKDVSAWYKISDLSILSVLSYPVVFSPNGRKFLIESRNRSSEGVVEYTLKLDTGSNRIVLDSRFVLDRKTITTTSNFNAVTTYNNANQILTYSKVYTSSMSGGAYAFFGYNRDNQICTITKTYAESESSSHSIDNGNSNPAIFLQTQTANTLRNNTTNSTVLSINLPSAFNTTNSYTNLNSYEDTFDATIAHYISIQQIRVETLLLNSIYPFSLYVTYTDTSNSNSTGTLDTEDKPTEECPHSIADSSATTSGRTDENRTAAIVCGQEFDPLTFTNPIFPASSCQVHCVTYQESPACPESWCDPPKEDEEDTPILDCYELGYGRASFTAPVFDQSSSTETTEDYWQATHEAAAPINYRNELKFSFEVSNRVVAAHVFYGDGVFVYQKTESELYLEEGELKWSLIEQKVNAYAFDKAGITNSVDLLTMFNDVYKDKIDSETPQFVSLPPYNYDPYNPNNNVFAFKNKGIM